MKSHIPAESQFLERSQEDAFCKPVATDGERARNEPAHCKTARRVIFDASDITREVWLELEPLRRAISRPSILTRWKHVEESAG